MKPFLVLGTLLVTVIAVSQERDWDYYTKFDYSKKLLTAEDLKQPPRNWDRTQALPIIRGIIFAKHGRIFKNDDIGNFLAGEDWYKPNPKFSNSLLNETERQNIDLIRGAEAAMHTTVQPGDLRWWRNRNIPDAHLKGRTLNDIHIMRAEVEAIHGKTFPDQPSLQKYFSDRYWYKAAPTYKPLLNSFETANLKKLAAAESKIRGTKIGPGALIAFNKPLTSDDLKNLTLHELRLLRNEVYAAKGATFDTWWLQNHFSGQEWYSPLPEGRKATLDKQDHQNLAVILREEKKRHDDLARRRFSKKDFAGMRSEDAKKLRSEIYAKHGKTFNDPWLQGYFASQSWYKPNRRYSDKLLSSIERHNVRQIQRHEKQAFDHEAATEG